MADHVAFRVTAVVKMDGSDEAPNQYLWDELRERIAALVDEDKYLPILANIAP